MSSSNSDKNKSVDLSNPCIFSLVQSTEHPTFAVEYKHDKKNMTNKSTTSVTKDNMTQHNITEKFDANDTKSNMIRNIFLIALFVLILYIICAIINENKVNKKYFMKPNFLLSPLNK
jgi:Na+/glutamate symporter